MTFDVFAYNEFFRHAYAFETIDTFWFLLTFVFKQVEGNVSK